MTNKKHFPITLSQWEFNYDLLTNLPKIIVTCNFSRGSFKPRRVIVPLFTKYVSELKNYLPHQPKLSLVNWTPRELTPCKISHICCCAFMKKSYHYQIYHCLRVKTSLYQKLFQTEKNKLLLWIYAQRLSGHLWSNGQWKSRVTSPN